MSFSLLLERLQQSDFYPHPVASPIQVIQTHISVVFLTGDYAYKLKKSVDFGFLDFSTREKRQFCLEEELRLNQPIAPDIYLEVLPIVEKNNDLFLNQEGEVVEYVLKMNQFPQDSLLINLFNENLLTPEHLEELGRTVANFHQNCLANAYINSFGRSEKIKEAIEDNYLRTQKYIDIIQSHQQYAATKAFTDKFFIEKEEAFKQRQAQDKIRECHGDLHLKNICFWRNKMQLFDRIEFNEPFRFVDTMCDVAFVVMDLEARERKDLSNIFLNNYLEKTGDWLGLEVLPLYLNRQAYVRAKVNSFLLDDPHISTSEKAQAKSEAINYYHLAWEYTQPRQGKLFITSGISGSGKTTVAKKIAQENNGIYIRSDAVRKHLAGLDIETKGTAEIYTDSMNEKTYNKLLELAEILIVQGYTVILDAKFDQKSNREKALSLAQTYQVPFQIIYCQAPLGVLQERLAQRLGDISDATPDLLRQQEANFEPFSEIEKPYLYFEVNKSIDSDS